MKSILLFGAGKSASVLISYLLENAEANDWRVTIVDTNKDLIESKTKLHPRSDAVAADITDEEKRATLIIDSDIVISMMPPALHILIARDCLQYSKHLLTASYADAHISSLADEIREKGLLFLCEMGLDPGIDHMSALQLIHRIRESGGEITSFASHCGGLVAPESDNNPWHYKISWNPRNVVLAGKAGAEYLSGGEIVTEHYDQLFRADRTIATGDASFEKLSYYPNRNSLPYVELYDLKGIQDFIRTTLRYPDFMEGWANIIRLKLTDEVSAYHSDGLSLAGFFAQHFSKYDFISELEECGAHPHGLLIQQLDWLGINDHETFINRGLISAADGLQFALETKLPLAPGDRDMIVMQHEIGCMREGQSVTTISSLIVKGDDQVHTAMAKTVGLPLGIATKLILAGKINLTGLHLPVLPEIYEPVMAELADNGISFVEREV